MSGHAVTQVDDAYLEWMVSNARERLIIIAPGMSARLARIVADRWRLLGADHVLITLDVHAEVCRLGYGEIEGVTILARAARSLKTTLNTQDGIRIGVLIADDETLIYAPTPLCVEAGPRPLHTPKPRPNGVHLGHPPDALAREVGLGPGGVRDQTIGLDAAENAQIRAIQADLDTRPPQAFDLSRVLRVYAAHIEFVELHLKGCMIKRRRVRITPELMGLADATTRRLLKSTFALIDAEESEVWGEELVRIKDFIARRFLVNLPGFGHVVRVQDRPAFLTAVKALQRMLNRARARRVAHLQASIDRRLLSLKAALMPRLSQSIPPQWKPELAQRTLEQLLERKLAALTGSAKAQLCDARVDLRIKGVTLDMLTDPAFIAVTRRALPDLAAIHHELDVIPPSGRRPG